MLKTALMVVLTLFALMPEKALAAVLDGSVSIVPPGNDYLSAALLGTPSTVWSIPLLEWDQTAAVNIQAGVISPDGDSGAPAIHFVFASLNNNTSENWKALQLTVDGPASFSSPFIAPVSISRPEYTDIPNANPTSIIFDGLDWSPNDLSTTVTFGLDVIPSFTNEPVVLSFRPIAVPEPGSAAIFGIGWALLARRKCGVQSHVKSFNG